eukprot:sb/3476028/
MVTMVSTVTVNIPTIKHMAARGAENGKIVKYSVVGKGIAKLGLVKSTSKLLNSFTAQAVTMVTMYDNYGNHGRELVIGRGDTSKQPIRTRCSGHMTGSQPIRDQYFLIRSVPSYCIVISRP